LRMHWAQPRFYRDLAAAILALPHCARETIGQPVPRHIPVTVLSGSHQLRASLERHRALATKHTIVEGSAHWIHLDRPALVAKAILSATVT